MSSSAVPAPPLSDFLDTREAAEFLRLKPRKLYGLVAQADVPHTRVGAKLLFRRAELEAWLASSHRGGAAPAATPRPPLLLAGSHDPLFEWAVRESRCGLASLTLGSRDGLERVASGTACAATVHLPEPDLSGFNGPTLRARLVGADVAMLHLCRRTQGLIVAPGNPRKLRSIGDVAKKGLRIAARQEGAGSRLLFELLLQRAGLKGSQLSVIDYAPKSEFDLARAVREGRADVGFGIAAAASQLGLGFVPLTEESFDLIVHRPSYFETPVQQLMRFCEGRTFTREGQRWTGYDFTHFGEVIWNA